MRFFLIRQHFSKQPPAPAQTRHYRPDGNIQDSGRFFVRKLFDVDQKNYRPKVLWDRREAGRYLPIRDVLRQGRAGGRGSFYCPTM
jgi:hypothetical protein